MARPLFIKNSNASWTQASDYNINNGSWTRGKLIYIKTDNGWEHEHDYQDQVWLAAATCQNGTKYQDDCPCGEAHGAPYYSGPADPDNHTGVQVYGGTALSHIEYSCCGLITSAIHTYGNPSYTWNSSSSCTASADCECQYHLSETVTPSFLTSAAANCLYPRREDYRATFSNSIFYPQIKSFYYGNVDSTNHLSYAIIDSYTPNGYEHYTHTVNAKYECCGETYSYSENCSNYYYGATVMQPTCGQAGMTERLCGVCNGLADYDYSYPPATGNHTEGQPEYEPINPTSHKKTIKCTTCGQIVSEEYETHEFSVGTTFTACIHCGYVQ